MRINFVNITLNLIESLIAKLVEQDTHCSQLRLPLGASRAFILCTYLLFYTSSRSGHYLGGDVQLRLAPWHQPRHKYLHVCHLSEK